VSTTFLKIFLGAKSEFLSYFKRGQNKPKSLNNNKKRPAKGSKTGQNKVGLSA
jgi:hypothetical protein